MDLNSAFDLVNLKRDKNNFDEIIPGDKVEELKEEFDD